MEYEMQISEKVGSNEKTDNTARMNIETANKT
jgi:hypothetical protein